MKTADLRGHLLTELQRVEEKAGEEFPRSLSTKGTYDHFLCCLLITIEELLNAPGRGVAQTICDGLREKYGLSPLLATLTSKALAKLLSTVLKGTLGLPGMSPKQAAVVLCTLLADDDEEYCCWVLDALGGVVGGAVAKEVFAEVSVVTASNMDSWVASES